MLSILKPMQNTWPQGLVHFGNMGIILTNLVEGLLDDTNTIYQGCMPSGSRQEDLLCVPYINLWKTCESGAGHNWP